VQNAGMYCKVARSINVFVVLLMSLEILGASITALPSTAEYALSICSEDTASGGLGFLMFEKAEEENEKTEEENAHLHRPLLIDFSRIALSLSAFHSPAQIESTSFFRYTVRPPVHQLNCVFLV
jgi:hypothetical protein